MTEEFNGRSLFYDLGYRFLKKFWGRGYATETARASVGYGFINMKLNEICGMADIENSASNRVLQKMGMSRTGTFLLDGAEHFFYEVSREDWLSKSSQELHQ
ncbi:MAG: N-acetyltransferase [Chitinophagaceae bacterium]|nr:MAG: N-acetyltransferase [Chitinophagaceae bacterium]